MSLTLKELLRFDYFKGLRLIAGEKGLSDPVEYCGFLDYELDPRLNKKYYNTNFKPRTLTLSSLYFAKDNPFQIIEAVKYLVAQNGSGLVIKNVFQLPIHESVLRYADYKNFPILLMDNSIMFEDFIVQTYQCIEASANAGAAELLLDRLLYGEVSVNERERAARQLIPSLRSQYFVVHVRTEEPLAVGVITQLRTSAAGAFPQDMVCAVYGYRGGAFVFLSREDFSGAQEDLLAAGAGIPDIPCLLGISAVHFAPEELGGAIREALFSSAIRHLERVYFPDRDVPYARYDQLGIYRALLPVWGNPALTQYSHQILEPVIAFDAENQGSLMRTLLMLIQCGGDLHRLARELGQHENTLRYRLNKVFTLTGFNYQNPAHYEELALAVRIFLLSQEDIPV